MPNPVLPSTSEIKTLGLPDFPNAFGHGTSSLFVYSSFSLYHVSTSIM